VESRVNYIVVGIFVLALSAALAFGIYWLTSVNHKEYDYFLVYMNESVSGLSINSAVKFNGVEVGYVKEIRLNPDNPQQVRILLAIEKNTPINSGTTATLIAQGVTGVTTLGLKALAPKAPPLIPPPGSPYPVIPSTPSFLVEISTLLRDATNSIKNLSNSVQEAFNPQNQRAISEILHNVSAASKNFQSTMQNISHAANKFSTLSDQATTTLASGDAAIKNISQQTLPTIAQAVDRLQNILINLDQLSDELHANPSMLIRGKQPLPRGPGE
jgi:phospholipid/cholesterol/gamma-HCH transport system substrate-binding protein